MKNELLSEISIEVENIQEIFKHHFFIHGYGFKLKWEQLKPLAEDAENLFSEFKKQLDEFLKMI
ncbi:MAG: hypothetical protein COS84_09020 [Armatimonadetes bacterium CG07_land_8_20_14_0_80_40_9]|nr:MAG: hypothetical protein COS84_09020 [Armatimonadetes bacterium CG07_land_8_20_14_0_80_40_9]